MDKIDAGNGDISEYDINSIEPLLMFKKLKELNLRNTSIEKFDLLAEFKTLEVLHLELTMIDSLETIENLNLKELNITNCFLLPLQSVIQFKSKNPACNIYVGWDFENQQYLKF